MKRLALFDPLVPEDQQHQVFRMICLPQYGPEREVLSEWSEGFEDRDGKFIKEFQTTFEPCLWELYLHACIKELGGSCDFTYPSPDFVTTLGQNLCIEAAVAQPAAGESPAYGFSASAIPEEFSDFNAQSTLRICNSFTKKASEWEKKYSKLTHAENRPFVVAIASFDRPYAHMASNRPIMAALYSVYFDEDETLRAKANEIIRYPVTGVNKTSTAHVQMGYFSDSAFEDISAVIYSCLATWGKVRALADSPEARTIYTTFHPNPDDLLPRVRKCAKADYHEHLLDGLYIMHNPYARHPIDPSVFEHPRVAQAVFDEDGNLELKGPDDFLLMRFLQSFLPKSP